MRALVLGLAVALSLAGCGKSDDADSERQGSQMTAEAIASNDITAIDAVTGEAANMAADVVIDANLVADGNASANASADGPRTRRPTRSGASAGAAPAAPANDAAPAAEPQANSAE